jgi:hypothetical protein
MFDQNKGVSAPSLSSAVSVHRPATREPDPHGDMRGVTPLDQCLRSVAPAVDETVLLWLCEKVSVIRIAIPRHAEHLVPDYDTRHGPAPVGVAEYAGTGPAGAR